MWCRRSRIGTVLWLALIVVAGATSWEHRWRSLDVCPTSAPDSVSPVGHRPYFQWDTGRQLLDWPVQGWWSDRPGPGGCAACRDRSMARHPRRAGGPRMNGPDDELDVLIEPADGHSVEDVVQRLHEVG